jgi:hypothetical protein
MLARHLAAAATALLLAAGSGLLAGSADADRFWLRGVVFAACTLGPAYGLGWLLFVSGKTGPAPVVRAEETVEHDWWQRSASGSFVDLITVAGVGACVLSVVDLDVAASTALAALITFAFADVAIRHAVLRRRAA